MSLTSDELAETLTILNGTPTKELAECWAKDDRLRQDVLRAAGHLLRAALHDQFPRDAAASPSADRPDCRELLGRLRAVAECWERTRPSGQASEGPLTSCLPDEIASSSDLFYYVECDLGDGLRRERPLEVLLENFQSRRKSPHFVRSVSNVRDVGERHWLLEMHLQGQNTVKQPKYAVATGPAGRVLALFAVDFLRKGVLERPDPPGQSLRMINPVAFSLFTLKAWQFVGRHLRRGGESAGLRWRAGFASPGIPDRKIVLCIPEKSDRAAAAGPAENRGLSPPFDLEWSVGIRPDPALQALETAREIYKRFNLPPGDVRHGQGDGLVDPGDDA